MDESCRDLEAQSVHVIHQVVEYLVAPEGSCGVGDSHRDPGFLHSLENLPQGEGAEICCRPLTVEELVYGASSAVVWDPCVGDVDRDPLKGN